MKEIKLSSKAFAEQLFSHLKEIKGINATLSEKDSKFVLAYELKADDMEGPESEKEGEDCVEEQINNAISQIINYMDVRVQYIYEAIDKLWQATYEHNRGHLPPLTASGLSKLIKVAGEESNYEVMPRPIYASQNGIEFGAQELKDALTKINEDSAHPQDADVSRLMEQIKANKK